MNWGELGMITVAVISSLGGGGVIILGLADRIGKVLAATYVEQVKHEIQQEIESYKTKLKKSEFLFQKEFEAASQFISLHHSFLPGYRFSEMIREDVCTDVAFRFGEIEEKLTQYRATHGAVLQQDALDHLSEAIDKAASGKFEVRRDDVSLEGIDLADEVMKELKEIEEELRKAVWSQSST